MAVQVSAGKNEKLHPGEHRPRTPCCRRTACTAQHHHINALMLHEQLHPAMVCFLSWLERVSRALLLSRCVQCSWGTQVLCNARALSASSSFRLAPRLVPTTNHPSV